MLSREDVVEIVALHRRGWSISAIARHTGRDRKTVRAWLQGERQRKPRAPSALEPFREYVARRFADDPHLDATVLLRELRTLGFVRSYPTLTRELRRLGLRPECPVCKRGGHRLTVELAHEPQLAHRSDDGDRRHALGPVAAGGGGAGQALRGHGRRLPPLSAAAQGRR